MAKQTKREHRREMQERRAAADAAYRKSLGVEPGEPLPNSIGTGVGGAGGGARGVGQGRSGRRGSLLNQRRAQATRRKKTS